MITGAGRGIGLATALTLARAGADVALVARSEDELLAAAQGVEFHDPQKSSPVLEQVLAWLREVSPPYTEDRALAADVTRVAAMIDTGRFCEHSASILPSFAQ